MASTRFRIPLVRGQPISRLGLIDRLDKAIDEGVIVSVVAGAGYGKSTLLAQWANRRMATQPIAWIPVDRLDITPVQRTRALLESINALYPDEDPCDVDRICQSITRPDAAVDVAIDEIEALMNRREGPPLVWIWDDIHVIEQASVWIWLDHFLARMSEHVRIVMIGRTRPRLAHAGRLARGEMLEITEQDLRFSLEETTRLAEQTPHGFGDLSLEDMYRRTRGWVTGIKLLTAAGQGRDGLVDRPELFDFFAEEVLAGLPEELQLFLSKVSVLDVINPASAAHVARIDSSAAARLIDSLIQRNLFLSVVDPNRHEIRLHDLLRDCLQARLRGADGSGLADLHRLAAEFESDPVRGSRHWMVAGDLPRAIELLAQCPERLIKTGRIRLIEEALAQVLPGSALSTSGAVLYLRAWVLYHSMDFIAAAEHFEQSTSALRNAAMFDAMASAAIAGARAWSYAANIDASRHLLSGVNPEGLSLAVRAEYELEWAWLLTAIGDGQAGGERLALACELIERARSQDLIIRCVDRVRSQLLGIPGSVPAFENMHRCVESAGEAIDDVSRTHGRVIGAWAALWRGDIDRAESLLSSSLGSLSAWEPIRTLFVDLSVCGALLAQARNDFPRARALIEGLLTRRGALASTISASWDATYQWLLGRQCWQSGDVQGLRQSYARLLTLGQGMRWPFLATAVTHVESLMALSEQRHEEAATKLRAVVEQTRRFNVISICGDPRVELAFAYYQSNDHESARRYFEEAVLEVCDTGFLGPLLLEPLAVLQSLRPLVSSNHPRWASMTAIIDLACQLRGASMPLPLKVSIPSLMDVKSGGAMDRARGVGTEPLESGGVRLLPALTRLSERENEVMRCIVEGASNKRIAQRLNLSPHTVKRHVANILDKTDAHSRAALIALALSGHSAR
jgi:LuxR family transcriptional regulator, maltose regulon positive regulatory protein